MRIYSYVLDHDVGFAPNPHHGLCSLAACKPDIRRTANLGDLVIGTGSKPSGLMGHMLYYMKIDEIIDAQQYWDEARFRVRRPQMNGSLMQQHGDNIYRRDPETGKWLQCNSFHSNPDGTQDIKNFNRDTGSTARVLLGSEFAYWGAAAPRIPEELQDFVHSTQGHKCRFPPDRVDAFTAWLDTLPRPDRIGRPIHWPAAAI